MRRIAGGAALTAMLGLVAAGAATAQVGPVGITAPADAGKYADPPSGALVTLPSAPDRLVAAGDRVVFTGGFDRIGPYTGAAALLRSDSQVRLPAAAIKGQVSDALALGGGFLVAGDFLKVGTLPRKNLARLTADGAVDATFAPDFPGFVSALAADGGRIFAGGKNAPLAGSTAPPGSLVAVDARTGARDAGFSPGPLAVVRELAAGGGRLYVSTETDLRALDATTGAQDAGFDPAASGSVTALLLTDAGLWVGGRLGADEATGAQRCLVLLDPQTGAQRTAPLLCDGGEARIDVLAATSGGRVVAGGRFGSIGDAASAGVALIRPDGSADPAFRANVRTSIYDLAVVGERIVTGGRGSDDGRNDLLTLSAANGRPVTGVTATRVDGPLNAIAAGSGRILAAGEFRTVNPVPRNGIAAIDGRTGVLDPTFRPPAGLRDLYDLTVAGPRIYAVGSLRLGGRPRSLVAFDARTGAPVPSFVSARPLKDGYVYEAPTVLGPRVYRLGAKRIQVLDARTGRQVRAVPIRLPGTTNALAAARGSLYVGGSFRRNRGGRPANLAILRIDPESGRVRSAFDPHADGEVYGLSAIGGSLYANGSFDHVGHVRRPGLAAVSLTTGGLRTRFAPTVGGRAAQAAGRYIAVQRDGLLVLDRRTGRSVPGLVPRDETGAFAPTVGGLAVGAQTNGLLGNNDSRYSIPFVGLLRPKARSRAATRAATPRQAPPVPDDATLPQVAGRAGGRLVTNADVTGVARAGSRLVALGSFTRAGARTGAALLAGADGAPAIAATPRLDGDVSVAVPDGDGGAFVGGRFDDGRSVVRVGADGRVSAGFAVRTNGAVTALALDGDRLVVGGTFTKVGEQARLRLARVAASSGRLDGGFRADRGEQVRALALQGDRLYVAGANGEFVAVARSSGVLIPRFRPGITGSVAALVARPDRLLAAGVLNQRASGDPAGLVALDLDNGGLVPGFERASPQGRNGSGAVVRAMVALGDRLAVAGQFVHFGGVATNGVALVDPQTGTTDPAWVATGPANVDEIASAPDGAALFVASAEILGGVGRLPAAGGGAPKRIGPFLDGDVGALVGLADRVLVGGGFTAAGARALPGITVADARSGRPVPTFRPERTAVGLVAATPTRVLLAGRLRTAAGRAAPGRLVALDARTGKVRASFKPRPGFLPERLVTLGERVFAMADGRVLRIDDRGRAHRIPGLRGYAMDLRAWRGRLLVAGSFTGPGGRSGLIALDPSSLRRIASFRVTADGEVSAIAPYGDRLYALGLFGRVGAARRPGLALLGADRGGLLSAFAPRFRPDQLDGLVAAPGRLIVGGRIVTARGTVLKERQAARERRAEPDPDAVYGDGGDVLVASRIDDRRRELRLVSP